MTAAFLLGAVLAAREAGAVCTYDTLMTGVPRTVPALGHHFFQFTQSTNYWCAVGVRSAPTTNWNLFVSRLRAIEPLCVFDTLGSSEEAGLVDVVVGDFNHNPFGNSYPSAVLIAGDDPATVEWDDGPAELVVNGAPTQRTVVAADVVEIWDVFLEAGVTYHLEHSSTGSLSPSFLLFRNPTTQPYWSGRAGRAHDFAGGDYTAPASDWYGLVFVNENGGSGSLSLGIGACTPPVALVSGAPRASADATQYFAAAPPGNAWSAIGTRAVSDGVNFDLATYENAAGSAWPDCFGSETALSDAAAGIADFILLDTHGSSVTSLYARPYLAGGQPGSSVTEYEAGGEVLTVDAPAVERNTGPGDVLEVWDVMLSAAQTYTVDLDASAGVAARALLYESTSLGPFWVERAARVFETAAADAYTPASSGSFGLVVVNDNGATGNYRIRVASGSVASPEPRVPSRTMLRGALPNPLVHTAAVAFDLATPGRVALDLVDVSGRAVARLADRPYGAGTWSVRWDRRGEASLAAGVYFLRMRVNEHEVGVTKVVLVH